MDWKIVAGVALVLFCIYMILRNPILKKWKEKKERKEWDKQTAEEIREIRRRAVEEESKFYASRKK